MQNFSEFFTFFQNFRGFARFLCAARVFAAVRKHVCRSRAAEHLLHKREADLAKDIIDIVRIGDAFAGDDGTEEPLMFYDKCIHSVIIAVLDLRQQELENGIVLPANKAQYRKTKLSWRFCEV